MATTIFAAILLGYQNVPYKWGGSTYRGLDCSGFILKALHDYGLTLPDMTAQGIYYWALKQDENFNCEPTETDCLLFFGSSVERITHIEASLGGGFMIGASGAGRDSLDMTFEELAQKDARVKIKRISSRRDLVASIKLGVLYGKRFAQR